MALPTRPIGRTGLSTTLLSLGTWGLAEQAYGPVERKDFEATVDAAFEAGIRTFDMAPLWGNGLAEEVVGEVLGERRSECLLVTRVGAERKGSDVLRPFDPKYVVAVCDESRERLGTSHLDVLLLHEPLEKVLVHGASVKALAQLVGEKAIRAWGVSVSTAERARIALSLGAKILVLPYHLLASDLFLELEPEIEMAGAAVFARSPFAHGLLFGQWKVGRTFPPGDHRKERWSETSLELRLRHVDALRFLVKGDVPTLGAAALRYVLSSPYVASAIVGAHTPEQVRELAAWTEGGDLLPEDDLARIPQVLSALGA